MIRIYIDWNVVSSLKREEFKDIKEFIDKHKKYLLFPYSPAHFNDLMKSYFPDNALFETDLETLQYLSEKHPIRWEEDAVKPLFGTPKEYFEGERDREDIFSLMDMEKIFTTLESSSNELGLGKFGSTLKTLFQSQTLGIDLRNQDQLKKIFPNLRSNSTIWDLLKEIGPFSKKLMQDGDFYKDFRKSIDAGGFKLESNSGNWSYDEVIRNIDDYLSSLGTKMTYHEFVESTFKNRKQPINRHEYYISAYLLLDMIGYKRDKLPKSTDNMQNIQTDAEHSFYGAYCDYFVANDKVLRIKSKVLYNEFNINTTILEADQLIPELEKVIDPSPKEANFLKEALSFCKKENLVENIPISKDHDYETPYKLPKFYFNFFNYLICYNYPEQNAVVFTFRRVFKNYSNFIYYTESERLIDSVAEYFGYDDKHKLEIKKREFIYENQQAVFDWTFEGGIVRLENEEETKRPILSYIISTKEES